MDSSSKTMERILCWISLKKKLHPNSPHNRINFFQPKVGDVDVVEIDSVGRRPCEDFIGCKLEEI